MLNQKIDLNGDWKAKGTDESGKAIEFAGSVPGCVHTDLIAGKYIDKDIFWRDNAKKIQWIEERDWIYKKEFTVEKIKSGAVLCFEGLDVYCDIYLNGKHLGFCDDMFIPHKFEIDGVLQEGKNTIEVYFYSPTVFVRGKKSRPAAFTFERLYTRRMQCTYGWDWVYRFVTCGIFRPVYIEFKNDIYAESVYINTESIDEFSAQVSCDIAFGGEKINSGSTAVCEIYSPDGVLVCRDEFFTAENRHIRYFDIKDPQLWDPFCKDETFLYTLKIYIDGRQDIEQKYGIRTVKILQASDEPGSPEYNLCRWLKTDSGSADMYDMNESFSCFTLMVNGKKIFCKGANWVPSEPFASAEKDEKITSILELSKKAGLNMIRVWGGGLFEREHFYSECDRLGIMVTQDFLMACGEYPEDEEYFSKLLKKEVKYAALMLRNHPCLMWWSGDNENAVNGSDKMRDYRGRVSAYKSIAPELMKYDPRHRFLPSSPYGGDRYASKTAGTTHNTQYLSFIFSYLDKDDLSDYKEEFEKYLARFVAEEPAMGACFLPSLRKMMTEDDIFGDNTEMWHFHTQTGVGFGKELIDYNLEFAEKVLGKFTDTGDKFFKFKYIGYEWIRITLEKFRRNQWFSSGVIYWMLNDCWPASSGWAIIDYYVQPKPSYYAFKRCAADYMISVLKEDGRYSVRLCSNSVSQVCPKGILTVYCINKDGKKEKAAEIETGFLPNEVHIERLPDIYKDHLAVVCDFKSENVFDRAFYKDGALNISECAGLETVRKENGKITVKSSRYIHAVELEGETVFEDNYFSLLPGEERTISYDAQCDNIIVKSYTFSELCE